LREKLAVFNGQRRKFRAIFSKYGEKNYRGHIKITLLLLDVTDVLTHKVVTDHLWFTMGKKFGLLSLKEGEEVEFTARVSTYEKGYIRDIWDAKEIDYHLKYPSDLRKFVLEEGQSRLLEEVHKS